MKRLTAFAAIVLGLVVAVLVFLRGSRPTSIAPKDTVSSEPETAKPESRAPAKPSPEGWARVRSSPKPTKSSEDGGDRPLPLAELARDRYYERLFTTTTRDPEHERELLSKLAEAFSDKPDVSLGEVACNAEFCRAEIYASAKQDQQGDSGPLEQDEQRENGRTLMVAVEAKGLRFCMFDRDATRTKAGCYFGRDDSWTAPSF